MNRLVPSRAYLISGMSQSMWHNSHTQFGQPASIATVYLGCLRGTRLWHLFEVRIRKRDAGVLLMTDTDLARLNIEEI